MIYFNWIEIPVLWDCFSRVWCNFGSVKLTSLHRSKRWLCWKSCSLIHEANYLLAKPLRIKAHSALQTLISVNTVVLTGRKQSGVGQHTFMFTEQEHLQPSTIITCGEQIADSQLYLPPPPRLDVRKKRSGPSETPALIFSDKPGLSDRWIAPKPAAKHLVWLRSPPLLTLPKASRATIKRSRHGLSVAQDTSIREMQQWKRTRLTERQMCFVIRGVDYVIYRRY